MFMIGEIYYPYPIPRSLEELIPNTILKYSEAIRLQYFSLTVTKNWKSEYLPCTSWYFIQQHKFYNT